MITGRRQKARRIQGVDMVAPPSMGDHGEDVYVWLTENTALVWMGAEGPDDWALAVMVKRGRLDELGPALRAFAMREEVAA
jgi:hypothetical protein